MAQFRIVMATHHSGVSDEMDLAAGLRDLLLVPCPLEPTQNARTMSLSPKLDETSRFRMIPIG